MTGLRPPSVHRVPAARLVDRVAEVSVLVRGKSVIDLGFVDEGQLSSKREHGIWLHEQVAAAAREDGRDRRRPGRRRAPASSASPRTSPMWRTRARSPASASRLPRSCSPAS